MLVNCYCSSIGIVGIDLNQISLPFSAKGPRQIDGQQMAHPMQANRVTFTLSIEGINCPIHKSTDRINLAQWQTSGKFLATFVYRWSVSESRK